MYKWDKIMETYTKQDRQPTEWCIYKNFCCDIRPCSTCTTDIPNEWETFFKNADQEELASMCKSLAYNEQNILKEKGIFKTIAELSVEMERICKLSPVKNIIRLAREKKGEKND